MKSIAVMLAFIVAVASASAVAQAPLRIDASSDAAARASWEAMLSSATPTEHQELLNALLQINLAGVQSAKQVVGQPGMQHLGIVRIKDTVAGLTAEQIIKLGNQVSTIKIEPSGS